MGNIYIGVLISVFGVVCKSGRSYDQKLSLIIRYKNTKQIS